MEKIFRGGRLSRWRLKDKLKNKLQNFFCDALGFSLIGPVVEAQSRGGVEFNDGCVVLGGLMKIFNDHVNAADLKTNNFGSGLSQFNQ